MDRDSYSNGYDAGVKIACAMHGVSPKDIIRHDAFSEKFLADNVMQAHLCKIAATAFQKAGLEDSVEYHLYNNMCKVASVRPLHNYTVEEFVVPVLHALSGEAQTIHNEVEGQGFRKQATSILSFIADTAGKAVASVPGISKDILALSALGGAGVGSLAWALNRDSQVDSEEADEKHAQAMHYKRIAEDLRKRLGSSVAVNKAIKKDVEDAAEGAYLL